MQLLLEQGLSATFILAVLWVLIKKVFSQYEIRIDNMEAFLEESKQEISSLQDKVFELHNKIFDLQNEHIAALQKPD